MTSDTPSAATLRGKGPRGQPDRQRALITPISIDDLIEANAAWHEVDEGYTELRASLEQEVAALRELIQSEEVVPGQNLEQPGKQLLEAVGAQGQSSADQGSAQTHSEPARDPQTVLEALRSARREIQAARDLRDGGEQRLAEAHEQAHRAIEHAGEVKVARRAIAILLIVLSIVLADEIMLLAREITILAHEIRTAL